MIQTTMNKLYVLLLTAAMAATAYGQTPLTAAQQEQVVSQIDQAAKAMTTMQCSFTQTKSMKLLSRKMESRGVMYFKQPGKLRWQYTAPYEYTFVLNGDKVRIKSAKTSQQIDVQGNKVFRQVTNIILNTMTGGGLKSSADFTVTLYRQGDNYSARLVPKKKELKQLYNSIVIGFNPALTMVSSVRMEEKSGDATTVKLADVKTNTKIDESLFSTD